MATGEVNVSEKEHPKRSDGLLKSHGFLLDVVLVDLVLGDLVQGRGGAGPDAEKEAEVEVVELALELADDAPGVADEGRGEGEHGAGVARVGLEAPDGCTV